MSKPKAVLISDVHYNINTMLLADIAMREAIEKANQLMVPLIVAGDLHDTKANIRGECIKMMIDTISGCSIIPYIIVGNHDRINEKEAAHSLEFLDQYAHVVSHNVYVNSLDAYLIPYSSSPDDLVEYLCKVPEGSQIILHQGVMNSNSGHYIQDKSALPKEAFANFRSISGHYHTAQDIRCGRPRKGAVGLFSYIGNPYTLNFAEANDPPKGYAVLYDDGILERIPIKLRKHMVIDRPYDRLNGIQVGYILGDQVWLKVHGPRSILNKLDKVAIAKDMFYGDTNFKLDLIYSDAAKQDIQSDSMSVEYILDSLIDAEGETPEEKSILKALWREIV